MKIKIDIKDNKLCEMIVITDKGEVITIDQLTETEKDDIKRYLLSIHNSIELSKYKTSV